MKREFVFFINENKIAILKINNNEINFHKKDGEKFYPIDPNFWDWWKESIGLTESDEVFCYCIWDKENKIIFESDFFNKKLKNNTWNKDNMQRLYEYLTKNIPINDSIKIISPNKKFIGKSNAEKVFETNIVSNNTIIKKSNSPIEQKSITTKKGSPMQNFFKDKNEKNEAQRHKYLEGDQ